MSIKLMGFALAALAIMGVVAGGYTHYRNVLADRDAAIRRADLEAIGRAEAEQGLDMYKEHAEILTRAVIDDAKFKQAARQEIEAKDERLARHDFEKIAKRDPGHLETAVNRGTADVFRLFEEATAVDPGDGGAAAADSPAAAQPDPN